MYNQHPENASTNNVEIIKERKVDSSWENASYSGAFSVNDDIRFRISIPTSMGTQGVVLRINRDGENYWDIPLVLSSFELGREEYSIELNLRHLCGPVPALFFYEFLFLRGTRTLFTSSVNNYDFELSYHSESKFSLLVYEDYFTAKEWFGKGIMYHIFVDRFAKGDIAPWHREDVIMNDDWYHGVPQYAKNQGDKLKNNMFFGGNLKGIEDKLDYLESLGTKVIYLSPIFKAYSNHKYDTGDYMTVDEMFGGEDAFRSLLEKAKERGISIILDGVFNHTGDDSLYFNKYRKYDSIGACNDLNSPYKDWFNFKCYPCDYDSWWGIDILPKLNQNNENCRNYFVGEGGVIEKYTKMGIGGWRLDVADELPDEFLYRLRECVHKNSDGQGIVIGEVWENAAVKTAYGNRRNYFHGRQLDSVMNYPLRNGIIDFVTYGIADMLYNVLVEIYSSYPRCVSDSLMNILSTHDTERILTVLGDMYRPDAPNDHLAVMRMTAQEKETAIKRLKLASILQYTVYGIPSVFYGDEAGMEGYHDPFCRRPFPWGCENGELLEHYRKLGELRTIEKAFDRGSFRVLDHGKETITYERCKDDSRVVVIANGGENIFRTRLEGKWIDMLTYESFENYISVSQNSARILKQI